MQNNSILSKIKKAFTKQKTIHEELLELVNSFPDRFSHLEPFLGLFDPEKNSNVAFHVSSRSDGKTTGHTRAIYKLAQDYDLPTLIILPSDFMQRQMTNEMQFDLRDYCDCDPHLLETRKNKFGEEVLYDGKLIFGTCNLGDAMELKHSKGFLRRFGIAWIDEFIRFTSEYLADEIERLQMIIETMDKDFEREMDIKVLWTGNPMNFEAPVFEEYDMFEILENHELNKTEEYTVMLDDTSINVLLGVYKNEAVNEMKSSKLFKSRNGSNEGEFIFNNYKLKKLNKDIPTSHTVLQITDNQYVHIYKQLETVILGYSSGTKQTPDYTLDLTKVTKQTRYLPDTFIRPEYSKRFRKALYCYENAFTRVQFANNPKLMQIGYHRLAKEPPLEVDENIEWLEVMNEIERKFRLMVQYSDLVLEEERVI